MGATNNLRRVFGSAKNSMWGLSGATRAGCPRNELTTKWLNRLRATATTNNQEKFIPNFNQSLTGITKNQLVWMESLPSIGITIGKIFIPLMLLIKSRPNTTHSSKPNFWLMVLSPSAVSDQRQ